jgi:hypothetical protein
MTADAGAHCGGQACHDRELAEGKTPNEALRSLKRCVSDALYRSLKAVYIERTCS